MCHEEDSDFFVLSCSFSLDTKEREEEEELHLDINTLPVKHETVGHKSANLRPDMSSQYPDGLIKRVSSQRHININFRHQTRDNK